MYKSIKKKKKEKVIFTFQIISLHRNIVCITMYTIFT